MKLSQVNQAYRFVAIGLMLAKVSFFCEQTGILPDRLITWDDVGAGSHVSPPFLRDFGGSIVTGEHFFGFGFGQLANFQKITPAAEDSTEALQARMLELSKLRSRIDETEALQMVTNWLTALEVDVPAMEQKYRRKAIQWRYYPHGKEGEALLLPVFQFEWRGNILRRRPADEVAVVTVTVSGATKELMRYSVLDESLFLRPAIEIRDLQKLLEVTDEVFAALSPQEKLDLARSVAPEGYKDRLTPAILKSTAVTRPEMIRPQKAGADSPHRPPSPPENQPE